MEVLADRGLLRKVNAGEWNAALASLHANRAIDVETVIAAVRALGVILERDLPVGEGDVDELSNLPEIA